MEAGENLMLNIRFLLPWLVASLGPLVDAQAHAGAGRPKLPLELLPDTLAVCRLDVDADVPAWALVPARFTTISRTAQELSITTTQSTVPPGLQCERDYRALRVRGPLPFNLVGIVASIADPLAAAGLSIFAISTYDTDYVLIKERDLASATTVLQRAGHTITRVS
jgi:hypothetical protein